MCADLADGGAGGQAGDVRPRRRRGGGRRQVPAVAPLNHVAGHRSAAVRRRRRPLDRHRVVRDADQTHRRRRTRHR